MRVLRLALAVAGLLSTSAPAADEVQFAPLPTWSVPAAFPTDADQPDAQHDGRHRDAIDHFTRSLELDPTSAFALGRPPSRWR